MGLYCIPCRQCGGNFLWFSGNMDQRCPRCRMYACLPGPQLAVCSKCGETLQWDGHHFPDEGPYAF